MTPEHQAQFRRVQGRFTFFLCRIAFLLIMVLSLARGDASLGQTSAQGTQPAAQLSVSTVVTRSGYATTYQLAAGWNLISINLALDDASKALLLDKEARVLKDSNKAYAVSGNLAVSQACWIFCKTAEMLTLTGSPPPENFDFTASLKPGWNFIGPLTASALGDDGAAAWGWNGKHFYRTDTLLPGHGYFLYWSESGGLVEPPEDTYLVIDLSEGSEAALYPVSYLSAPPAGGWTDEYKTTKLVLKKIPAGTFIMGSPEDELERIDKETQHQVTLTKDFYVGVFEVTQKQWNLVMGDWPSYFSNPDYRDTRPVEHISYEDIRGSHAGSNWPANSAVDEESFLGVLRDKTNLNFDLPTVAQWEYACRAGATTALNSGKNLTAGVECPNMNDVGRYQQNGGENDAEGVEPSGGTNKVGSYLPNRWGLYDMHGNVEEWCLDRLDRETPDYSSEAATDPKGNDSGNMRILRSGSLYHNAGECRSASRSTALPSYSNNDNGFRLAVQPEPEPEPAPEPAADTYLVIDLSSGSEATIFPFTYRAAPPEGGWTEEYKTTKLVLRKIPAGAFTMGSPGGELGRENNETKHHVTLSKDFYAGVFEVTQKQWELVMGAWPSWFSNPDYRDSRPVEKVSYDDIRGSHAGSGWPANNAVDADSFLGVLRAKTGLTFDLPTEAQWEYACRAGTKTALNSKKNLTDEYECPNIDEVGRYWYNSGSDGSSDADTSSGTNTVGSYKPNHWGLYDMHGNVWELCLDWWLDSDYSAEAVTDPTGSASGRGRVMRGGSRIDPAYGCRSAYRGIYAPWRQDSHIGFRLVTAPAADTYLVIDLSAGSEAASYPFSWRATPPAEGWTEEYKTTKLVLRKIPAGTFMMGAPEDELGRDDNETLHQVTLTKDFYAGVFEVTQKQWELVMGTWPSYFSNPDYRDSRPVEMVRYEDIRGSHAGSGWPANNAVDADSFLGVLRAKTGLTFDLPTEAQWEYACRAGTATALNSGKNLTSKYECPNMGEVGRYWYNGGKELSEYVDTSGGTAAVGSYLPNGWGLYDMHGNVEEWCLDLTDGSDYPEEAVTDPKGDGDGNIRILRGGRFSNNAYKNRSATRNWNYPVNQDPWIGFRLVAVPVEDTFLVIDLSAGASTDTYPVSYYAAPPAEGWTDEYKTTKLVLRKIRAGSFTMGSPGDELGRNNDETQHQVTLTKDFYAGVFEVTQKQWSLVMGEDAWPSYFSNPGYRDSRPVEQVSYNDIRGSHAGSAWPYSNAVDADSFIGLLQAKTGLDFDLPTEAQWEYACRAGTTTALNSGKNLTATEDCPNVAELGRYYHNSQGVISQDSDTTNGTNTVGSYLPNLWGLYDMHGNVVEWCLDWYYDQLGSSAQTDPAGVVVGSGRVLRGGAWNRTAAGCRSARRDRNAPSSSGIIHQGFRLVAPPKPETEPEPEPTDAYLVIDLSAGSETSFYPVFYRTTPPVDGWTEEYKTTKLVLKKIPAGTFIMGSPEAELERYGATTEIQRQVTLTKDFYAGVFEVTQKQWNLVMGTWPSHFSNPDYRDSRPVEQVCYDDIRGRNDGSGWPDSNAVDADSFLGRLRAKTRLTFDLPTEAQWEYACRAGTTAALNSGKNLTRRSECPNLAELGRCQCNGGSDGSADVEPSGGTATVGSYLPNLWGLYDMHGNVAEWCLDWFDESYYSAEAVTDPRGVDAGANRISRGGGRDFLAASCRSAAQSIFSPTVKDKSLGFRLAASPEPEPVADSYLVIDLSAGASAGSYPSSCLSAPPAGGWTDEYKTTKLVLRKIPAGAFRMGSPEGELGRNDANETRHKVTLTRDFYAGVFEVTQKQWSLVMGKDAWPSYFSNPDCRDTRPVESVGYGDIRGTDLGLKWPTSNAVDADSFLGRLREKTGVDFDLPTDAQWEYACRAGTTSALSSGENLTDAVTCPNMDALGRYKGNRGEDNSKNCEPSGGTATVGSYQPNSLGLYDMHGNVLEWCLDWYKSDLGSSDQTDPPGASSGSTRTLRGGCWEHDASSCRSARRFNVTLLLPARRYGFRLVAPADTYLIVDLSPGVSAESYPFSYHAAPPAEGWTNEYKTTKLALRRIPAGAFSMGSPNTELGRDAREKQHDVTLTKDFYAGVFEVTQRQWNLVMGTWPSYFKNTSYRYTRPVEQVSYNDIRGTDTGSEWPAYNDVDASSFLGRLRQKTALVFDLPTEAQWEYACRAGTTSALYSGKELTGTVTCPNVAELGRYKGNRGTNNSSSCNLSGGTNAVGSYLPNGWGLYDMYGNVSEWCLDWHQEDLGSSGQTDPPGADSGRARIQRGGSWAHDANYCRSAKRYWAGPEELHGSRGFRITMQPQPEDTYLVIDLSAGTYAANYPITYRATAPVGGWPEEYKTMKLVLRKIPAGTFTMGSPTSELGREASRETRHRVTLSKDFYMGVFEVTQKQWNLVVGAWPSYFTNELYRNSRPVERVKYSEIRGNNDGTGWPDSNAVDADSFMGLLRTKTGLDFDLPTEAQWEYACRAGTTTALNSGKNLTDEYDCPNMAEVGRYSNIGGAASPPQDVDTSQGTNTVGSYKSNRWGLYDMHGNVEEWCLDWWNSESDYSTQAVTDPKGLASGTSRALRGGCQNDAAMGCRSAKRGGYQPGWTHIGAGFRLAWPMP